MLCIHTNISSYFWFSKQIQILVVSYHIVKVFSLKDCILCKLVNVVPSIAIYFVL